VVVALQVGVCAVLLKTSEVCTVPLMQQAGAGAEGITRVTEHIYY